MPYTGMQNAITNPWKACSMDRFTVRNEDIFLPMVKYWSDSVSQDLCQKFWKSIVELLKYVKKNVIINFDNVTGENTQEHNLHCTAHKPLTNYTGYQY